MTYKDVVLEMFLSAQRLLGDNKLYAANNLFYACWKVLSEENSIGIGLSKYRERIAEQIKQEIPFPTDEELQESLDFQQTRGACIGMTLEEYKAKMEAVFDSMPSLAIPTFDFIGINSAIDKNRLCNNRAKHGQEQKDTGGLDIDFPQELKFEEVAQLAKYVCGIIALLYNTSDVRQKLGIE